MLSVIERPAATTTTPAVAQRPARRLPRLAMGSPAAKALAALWNGDPAVVVESPPGAGKTALVTTVASHLAGRAGMRVAIAAQTNAQALDLANRLAAASNASPLSLLTRSDGKRPPGLANDVEWSKSAAKLSNGIVVATTARWQWIPTTRWRADLLIIDEAWQLTWADFGAIAPIGLACLAVGDPGQIAPVTTADTSRWHSHPAAPHHPAPEVLVAQRGDEVTRLRLPSTWRLGPVTTRLIQPLYRFAFDSARPARHYFAPGAAVAEPEVTTRTVVSHGGVDDPAIAAAIAARVRTLIGGTVREADGNTRTLLASDVGVVCSHVSQVAAVAARLAADHPEVMIDTAERHQGLEHEVVVLWLPLAGARTLSGFGLDSGRLCVGLSRHRCHLTVVTRHDTRAVLNTAGPDHDQNAVAKYRTVLDAIDALGE